MLDDILPALAADPVRNRRPQAEPFAHAVSLGSNCYAAWLLKQMGLKQASFPFDWIFSSPPMVADMLEDRFAAFLNPAQHGPAAADGAVHHRSYRQRFGVERVFNHADPTRPEVAAYFRRCADRFLSVTGGPDKVLLLMINTAGPVDPGLFARLCRAVDGLGERNTLLCLDVGRTGDVLNMGMGQPLQDGRHRLRVYRSTSDMDGVRFANPLDDLVLRSAVRQFRFALAG